MTIHVCEISTIRCSRTNREIFWNLVSCFVFKIFTFRLIRDSIVYLFASWILGAGIGIVSVALGVLRSGLNLQFSEGDQGCILTTDVREFIHLHQGDTPRNFIIVSNYPSQLQQCRS